MTASDHLGLYAEGWTNGNANTILQAVANDFIFDDPNSGKINKTEFTAYLETMKQNVQSLCGGKLPNPFMQLSEVVTQTEGNLLTAWCWWHVPGTDIKGSGLIKVSEDGVQSEIISYYAKCQA